MTTCRTIGELLPDFLESALPRHDEEAVAKHLQGCVDCRRDAAEAGKLLGAAKALPDPVPSAAAALATLERVEAMEPVPSPPPTCEILELGELADYLRVDVATVEVYLDEIPCFELGGKLLFRKTSIDHWIGERETAMRLPSLVSAGLHETVPKGGASWTL